MATKKDFLSNQKGRISIAGTAPPSNCMGWSSIAEVRSVPLYTWLMVKEAERRGGKEGEGILEERKQGGGNFHLQYFFIFLERLIIFND